MTQSNTKQFLTIASVVLSAAGISLVATPSLAQSNGWSASATVQVYAEVIQPLQVEAVAPLSFGGLRGGIDAGVVTISPNGERTMNGGAMSIDTALAQDGQQMAGGPAPGAGAYKVIGEAGRAYRVSTPQSVSVTGRAVDASGVAMALVASDFVVQTDSTPQAGSFGQLDASGRDRFSLGASIAVPASAPSAYYVIQVPVTVDYS